jgi:hypothetical protein
MNERWISQLLRWPGLRPEASKQDVFYEIRLCLGVVAGTNYLNSILKSKISLFFSRRGRSLSDISGLTCSVCAIFVPLLGDNRVENNGK